jgi:hypothetical protein
MTVGDFDEPRLTDTHTIFAGKLRCVVYNPAIFAGLQITRIINLLI